MTTEALTATKAAVTDEMVEAALISWFRSEVSWDKGMAPWTADQFRMDMRSTLIAALTPTVEKVETPAQGTPSPETQTEPVEIPGELEMFDGKLTKVVDAGRSGWWRFHEHYDRNGYCDNPGRGY